MGKEEKASFWLPLDHPFVDSWRSDISLSIPSCWVFLQHLTSFKASPLTSIDTDGREGERSCREGKSFWYQALISLVFIVKSLTISLTLNFFQVLYIQQRTGLFCFVSQIWLLILPEFFFFFFLWEKSFKHFQISLERSCLDSIKIQDEFLFCITPCLQPISNQEDNLHPGS